MRIGIRLRKGTLLVSVLFSEPKIPQFRTVRVPHPHHQRFQCSSASRKFLNSRAASIPRRAQRVSVLFSEPKIPQFESVIVWGRSGSRFSALQRAENSSICTASPASSSMMCFSALQRAENSSISSSFVFRNRVRSFSALQRAENSSIGASSSQLRQTFWVSVLFSEPKIPQYTHCAAATSASIGFSALQRAENSSIRSVRSATSSPVRRFSALQRAENSSIPEEC